MRRATVYRRGADILVHPSSQTTDGVWILSEPCIRLSRDCIESELGRVVLAALDGSKPLLPHPVRWQSVSGPLLRAAGVKTWKAFAGSAIYVEVEEQGGVLEIVPTVNLGTSEGFQVDKSKKITLSVHATPEAVGGALREALTSARGSGDR